MADHKKSITVQIFVGYQDGGELVNDTYTVKAPHAHSHVASDLRGIADRLEAIDWQDDAPL